MKIDEKTGVGGKNNTLSLRLRHFFAPKWEKHNIMLKILSIFFVISNFICLLMFCYYLLFFPATTKERVTFANENIQRYFVGFWTFLYLACIAESLRFQF